MLGKASVSREDRQRAKPVNFGYLYGQQAQGFLLYARNNYGVVFTLEEAKEIRRKFFKTYSGLRAWHRAAREQASDITEGRIILARRRLANPDDPSEQRDWNRFQLCINYEVQGGCADVTKIAMVNLFKRLAEFDAWFVATVHDEPIVDCPKKHSHAIEVLMSRIMEEAFYQVFGDDIPCVVDLKSCANWGEK